MADFIKRESAIKCAEESYKMWNLTMAAADGEREINKCYKMQELCKAIGEVFKIAPAADVAPVVHGHWVDPLGQDPYCSVCGFSYEREQGESAQTTDYCGRCGAKMDEE